MDVEELTDEVIDVEAERREKQAIAEFESNMLDSFPFFASKVIRIIDKEKRLVPLNLNKIQVIVQEIKADIRKRGMRVRLIIDKARQFGLSTEQLGENYWFASTNLRTTCLFVSHEPKSTVHLFDIVKRMHDKVPVSLLEWKPEKKKSNSYELVFKEIDSAIRVGTAGSDNMGSSQTINRLHLCCDAHTPVLVEHGRQKRIGDIRIGDKVITHNGHNAVVTEVSKKQYNDMPYGDMAIEITPWNGDAVIVSPEHKVFTGRGFMEAMHLTREDKLAMPIRKITHTFLSLPLDTKHRSRVGGNGGSVNGGVGRSGPDSFPLTKESGFFVGYYLAEGCLTNKTPNGYANINFAFGPGEDGYAMKAVGAVSPWYNIKKTRIVEFKNSKTRAINVRSVVLGNMLEKYFGRKDGKHIPDWVFECGTDFCEGLVTGYLCGDGSKTTREVLASSIRESITYQIRDLVSSLGFGWGRVKQTPGRMRYGRKCQTQWTVYFNGECGASLKNLMGYTEPITCSRSKRAVKYFMDTEHVWTQIKSIKTVTCNSFVDIAVHHEDHSFRTPHFSMSNSEMAKYPAHTVESLMISLLQTVPKSDMNSEVVVESTANGVGGEFYDMYWACRWRYIVYLDKGVPKWRLELNKDADPNNEYCALFIPCFAHDEYKLDPSVGFVRTPDEEKLVSLHGVGDEFLQWRRHTIANECKGNLSKFHQEYPCTDRESFLASGRPVFDNERILDKIRALEATPPIAYYDCIPDTGVFTNAKFVSGGDTNGLLMVWEEPKPGVSYTCSADVSEGIEIIKKQTDYSAVDVCEQLTGKQVAHWHGRIEPMQLAILLQHIGKRYNMAWLVPERNNHGTAVCGKLFELHYPNLYHEETPNPPHRPVKRYGWLTKGGKMGDAKALVIDNLRQALDAGVDGIMCIDTLKECMTYKHSADGKLGGEVGCFDDRVMSYAINQWVRKRLPMPPSMRAKQMTGQNISVSAWT